MKTRRRAEKKAIRPPNTLLQPGFSRLTRQVKDWDEDLPEVNEPQSAPPRLIRVNQINDVWMEIPRYEDKIAWWGAWLMLPISLLPTPFIYMFSQLSGVSSHRGFDFFVPLFVLFFSIALYHFRMAVFVPRGAPVRLNRKRQKVYVYEHKRGLPWFPWPTTIKVFDWADVHGEIVRKGGHYSSGYLLSCAVCRPGTYQVVDRFLLNFQAGGIHQKNLWSLCCQYMQGKNVPETPIITDVPWSWTPVKTIRWPDDVDRESTTAPEGPSWHVDNKRA